MLKSLKGINMAQTDHAICRIQLLQIATITLDHQFFAHSGC